MFIRGARSSRRHPATEGTLGLILKVVFTNNFRYICFFASLFCAVLFLLLYIYIYIYIYLHYIKIYTMYCIVLILFVKKKKKDGPSVLVLHSPRVIADIRRQRVIEL